MNKVKKSLESRDRVDFQNERKNPLEALERADSRNLAMMVKQNDAIIKLLRTLVQTVKEWKDADSIIEIFYISF